MKTKLYSHPDNDTEIQIERIKHGNGFDFGALHVTDESGKTIVVQVGQIGLIELGVKLANAGLQMLEVE